MYNTHTANANRSFHNLVNAIHDNLLADAMPQERGPDITSFHILQNSTAIVATAGESMGNLAALTPPQHRHFAKYLPVDVACLMTPFLQLSLQ